MFPASPSLTVQVIQRLDDWEALRPEWEELAAISPQISPPLQFDWLRTWWDCYAAPANTNRLQLITFRDSARLVGVAPLYASLRPAGPITIRTLQFLSTGEPEADETCPDYLNILCRPGSEADCARAFWNTVHTLPWDQLELVDLPTLSPLLAVDVLPAEMQLTSRADCPQCDLSAGFEQYLTTLSSNQRQTARRLIRKADQERAKLQVADPTQADEFFAELVRLHQGRWEDDGKPGVFASASFTDFHRRMLARWLPTGQAVLARLRLQGETLAVLYGFRCGGKYEFYQSGVRQHPALPSPGIVAHLLLMQQLAGEGVTVYDFLKGASTYKQRLATGQQPLASLECWRNTLPGLAYQFARFTRRFLRRHLTSPKRQG